MAGGRILGALNKARTGVGNQSVAVGGELEARLAGRLWTLSQGERTIYAGRGTGAAIGRISGDATRVYRAPQMKYTGPNAGQKAANLIRKDDAGTVLSNLHLIVPK